MKTFFHHIPESDRKAIANGGITWGELFEKYQQPKWCAYPDALGPLGCWSLTGGFVKGRKSCKNCDLYKYKGKSK